MTAAYMHYLPDLCRSRSRGLPASAREMFPRSVVRITGATEAGMSVLCALADDGSIWCMRPPAPNGTWVRVPRLPAAER